MHISIYTNMAIKIELTEDQIKEAVLLLQWGCTLKEVAEHLNITTITLKKHVEMPERLSLGSKLQILRDFGIIAKPKRAPVEFRLGSSKPKDWD